MSDLFEGRLITSPSKRSSFYQEESTRVYISDLFGTLFRVGVGRGVGQIGN
jgi:hypothetical protein